MGCNTLERAVDGRLVQASLSDASSLSNVHTVCSFRRGVATQSADVPVLVLRFLCAAVA